MKTAIYATGLSVLALLAFGAGSQAQDLDPVAAAGKVIFEETAGGVGCASCHGETGQGLEAPNIVGKDSVAIFQQLQSNPDMQFIKLTREEVEQVATYLRYLHDLEAH